VTICPSVDHTAVVSKNFEMKVGGQALTIVRTRSSNPMLSAHPISRPSACQPGLRRQACHRSPMVMLMPTLELASEKAWKSWTCWRPERGMDGSGSVLRVYFHQVISSGVVHGGGSGHEGVAAENSQHCLEVDEMGPTSWEND